MPADSANAGRRRYSSARRQQQAAETRAGVLAAAAARFSGSGWAGTGMRDVARDAGVSVETVYASFGSKGELLQAALDAAVVGDALPVPLAGRPEFAGLGEGAPAQRAAAAAALLAQVYARAAGLLLAVREGAAGDPALAARLDEDDERRRADVAGGGALVAGRPLTRQERDGLWAITGPDIYHSLTARSGWTVTQYQDWLTDVFIRLLSPAAHGEGSSE